MAKLDIEGTKKQSTKNIEVASKAEIKVEAVTQLPIEQVKENPANQEYFEDLANAELEELKENISKNGIETPLIITTDYLIISGHQRFRIAKEIGLKKIPCIIREYQNTMKAEMSLISDNIFRRHLTKQQKAEILAKYELKYNLTPKVGNPNLSNSAKVAKLEDTRKNEGKTDIEKLKSDIGISDRTMRNARAKVSGKEKISSEKSAKKKVPPVEKKKPVLKYRIDTHGLHVIKPSGKELDTIIQLLEKQFTMHEVNE